MSALKSCQIRCLSRWLAKKRRRHRAKQAIASLTLFEPILTEVIFMAVVPNRETFENLYAGKAPWDIGKPQQPFIDVADQIKGSVLDAGCGTGDTALFFASRGNKVTGIDFLEVPIKRAKQKAAERGLTATFLVMNAL